MIFNKLIYIIVFCSLVNISEGFSNDNMPVLLDSIKNKYLSVNDYQADITVEIDVDFINIPDKHARVFFKQPDKISYKTDGFILIPKKGIDFNITHILGMEYNALSVGKEPIGNTGTEVIKIIPLQAESELILATIWLDKLNMQVMQLEVNSKASGSFKMRFFYNTIKDILPGKIEVTFGLSQFNVPFEFLFNSESQLFKKKDKTETTTGKVTVHYSNYIINSGLPDSIFEKR